MTKKILISCIVFSISYCTVLGYVIKWSAIGSTEIMECLSSPYNTRDMFNRTKCFLMFSIFKQSYPRFSSFEKYDVIAHITNYNQSTGTIYFQISNVSMNDQGHYWCKCYYSTEDILITNMYTLKIKGQPRFLEKDENSTLLGTEGSNLTLTCVLEGGQSPDQLLVTSDGYIVAYGGPENLNYTFIPNRADHLTDYICIANSSQFDNPLVDRVTLYVRHIPDPPTNVSSNTCPSISWTPGASGNLPQVFYIEYKKVKTKLWDRIGPINQTSTTEMTYQISEISLDTFYEIRIFAENEIGRSIYSSVVRTIAFVIKPMNDDNLASKPLVPLQYWLVLGAVTVGLVVICILSHVCKHCGKKHPGSAANNLQLQTLYEEIGSVQYQFISVAPVVPPPRQDNVQINSTSYEIENENYLPGSFDNAEPDIALPGIDQTTSGRLYGHGVNVGNLQLHQQNDSLEPEFDSHSSVEQTVNAENYENPYTPLRQDIREEHHYSQCRNSDVFQEGSTQTIVDNSDYINLML